MLHQATTRLGLLLCALALTAACAGPGSDNHPPGLTRLDPIQIYVGDRRPIRMTATDRDGDPVQLSFTLVLFPGDPDRESIYRDAAALPSGIAWLPGTPTAVLEWAPSNDQVGQNHRLTFIADDGRGGRTEEAASVTIFPGQVESGTPGAPRFTSPPNLVLDLVRVESLSAKIRVEDPDSLNVALSLEGHPEGMELKASRDDGKEAELTWQPSREQIERQSVYSFWALANDQSNAPVRQRMSVVIRLRDGGVPTAACPGIPPVIEHQIISDQRGDDDYVIEARISDPDHPNPSDQPIQRAFVAYTSQDPDDINNYLSVPLEAPVASDQYLGAIPNLRRLEGVDPSQPTRIYYFICALDNDDPAGEDCDKFWCEPSEALFTFIAFPPEESSGIECPDDDREPNNSQELAPPIDGETRGLVLCPDDQDWFSISADDNDALIVTLTFDQGEGEIALNLIDPLGNPAGSTNISAASSQSLRVEQTLAGPYRVHVAGQILNTTGAVYDLAISQIPGGEQAECQQDPLEPNNDANRASAISAGSHGPFAICGAEDPEDWHRIELSAGQTIDINLRFQHEVGDLDLDLFAPEDSARPVARSVSVNDDEDLHYTATSGGTHLVRVYGWANARNSYRLEIAVSGGAGGGTCDAAMEPNEGPDQASPLLSSIGCARIDTADDSDWYSLDVDAMEGFQADILFSHAVDSDLDVLFFAADGVTEVIRATSANDNETVRFPGSLTARTWYLQVLGFDDSEADYSIELQRSLLGAAGQDCPLDRKEPNNTRIDSRILGIRDTAVYTLDGLSYCGDEDWFRFTHSGEGTVEVELEYNPARSDLQLQLLDEAEAPTGELDADNAAGYELGMVVEAGTYYARVSGPAAPANLYSLKLTRRP